MAIPTQTNIRTEPVSSTFSTHSPDQAADEERRSEHADHVPLQHERRGGKRMVAAEIHGERRGAHEQVHHAVAHGRRQHRHHHGRLAQDHPQRPLLQSGGAASAAAKR
jgi:hypothetical protein